MDKYFWHVSRKYWVGGEPQNIKAIVPWILLDVTKLSILSLKRESI